MRIELHKNAQEELQEAFEWYEERSEGLGKRFIEAVNRKLTKYLNTPSAIQNVLLNLEKFLPTFSFHSYL